MRHLDRFSAYAANAPTARTEIVDNDATTRLLN